MKKNYKKLLFVMFGISFLFLITGCSIPTEIDPQTQESVTKLITSDISFTDILKTEDWFQALLVWPLVKMMAILIPYTGVAGSIAFVTLGVNIIVMLITLKSTLSQQRMTDIQPQIIKIQKRYEDKKDEESKMKMVQEQQDLYKKNNINPLSSMLSIFLQLPVMYAIFHSVQRSSAVQNGEFLGLSLSQSLKDGIFNGEYMYLSMLLLLFLVQILSMRLPNIIANYKAKKTAKLKSVRYEKVIMQAKNMMNYMLIFILLMAFFGPGAMTIYWIISALVMIIKTLLLSFVFVKKEKINKKKISVSKL